MERVVADVELPENQSVLRGTPIQDPEDLGNREKGCGQGRGNSRQSQPSIHRDLTFR